MLPKLFILITLIFSISGYPSEDYNLAYQNSDQQVAQEPVNEDYFGFSDTSSSVYQEADFTVSCNGEDRICTSKNDCLNGYIYIDENFVRPLLNKGQECRVRDEVCCVLKTPLKTDTHYKYDEGAEFDGQGSVNSHGTEVFNGGNTVQTSAEAVPALTHVQNQCAAALLCVEDKFCTIEGTISPEPVLLTEKQLLRRVPLSTCRNAENGIIGKCCRDPTYVDPWPTGNLPANYSGGFDEKGFPTFLTITKVKFPKPSVPLPKPTPTPHPPSPTPVVNQEILEPALVPEDTVSSSKVLFPPRETIYESGSNVGEVILRCGDRRQTLRKPGMEESETVFAEIPWQAMVLHSQDRKILCSGALIDVNHVMTAASCVDSLLPSTVSIKLGEWKLGYELEQEEPLPFEIRNVSSINIHPGYTRGLGSHDLALLHLETPATLDLHVNPICMPTRNQLVQNSRSCIATGWGKSILQAHYAGAIMHAVSMNVLTTEHCKAHLTNANLSPNAAEDVLCATTKEQRNNVCEADVGGPLACVNEEGVYELVGIYSQDTGCLSTDQVGVFAPLDTEWITKMFYSNNDESPSVVVENYETNEGLGELTFTDSYRGSTLDADNQYLPPN